MATKDVAWFDMCCHITIERVFALNQVGDETPEIAWSINDLCYKRRFEPEKVTRT